MKHTKGMRIKVLATLPGISRYSLQEETLLDIQMQYHIWFCLILSKELLLMTARITLTPI